MQIGVELLDSSSVIGREKSMTNDKRSPVGVQEHYGQDVYQRSLSESEYLPSRTKRPRYEPLSDTMQNAYESKKYHRLIEKRRRDRINECIYQLKDLLPTDVIKSTSKPMEKAVILELVVKYMQSINRNGKDGRSPEYVRGYKECTDKVMGFLNSVLDEQQKEDLRNHLQHEIVVNKSQNGVTSSDGLLPSSPNGANETDESTKITWKNETMKSPGYSELTLTSFRGPGTSSDQEYPKDKHSRSSSSLSSSSPMSDFSLCADNSDSSGCQENDLKFAKRKFYSHHHHASHKSNNSNKVKRQPSSVATSTANQGQAPVFINMPFMMTPNIMPTAQFMSPDGTPIATEAQMPRMVQSFPVTTPTRMMVPQMSADANGVQFPTFFMTCGPQARTDNQPQQQSQNSQVEPVMMQPTMMMPVRNQGNFVFMQSYPMMPQFQTPTLIPMQTSTEEQTSPSE